MSWSASRGYIFKSYINALGKGRLKGINYGNLKVNITDNNFLSANYYRMKGLHAENQTSAEKAKDYLNLKLGDLSAKYTWIGAGKSVKGLNTYIYPTNEYLVNTNIDSINKYTNLSNIDISFEFVKDEPCSSVIFSPQHGNSWVTGDFDWDVNARKDTKLMKYFKEEYGFKDVYDRNEYNFYGVIENMLDENVVRLSAENFITNSSAMDYGAAGILLTYENKDKGYYGDKELPVAYYDFGKALHSNYNYLEIDWNETGVIKVE